MSRRTAWVLAAIAASTTVLAVLIAGAGAGEFGFNGTSSAEDRETFAAEEGGTGGSFTGEGERGGESYEDEEHEGEEEHEDEDQGHEGESEDHEEEDD